MERLKDKNYFDVDISAICTARAYLHGLASVHNTNWLCIEFDVFGVLPFVLVYRPISADNSIKCYYPAAVEFGRRKTTCRARATQIKEN